ncbi:hypothetical protein [Methylovirgula sp. HY1]|uniref:hyaluronate lyase N-terminal domain-containing protein n=1 Tax=Methylovirgula sp. HY1 TaxID=2822761 RepID=UPI001C5B484F|nr:hypothetical protein [Methylovirgula sp. HY1]QXX74220.1 hypothetical protein MHY1_01030 [Methylovirgula sp. HY1]
MASAQLQLRRGTAAQVAEFMGPPGEVVFDTTNRRLVAQDGATVGGFPVNGVFGQFGSSLQPTLLEGGNEPLPTASANYTSIIAIPANCMLLAVSYIIKQPITGATAFELGIAGTPAKFATGLAPGAGSIAIPCGPFVFAAATNLLLTSTAGGDFTGGAIRFALAYLSFGAPTT